MYLHTHILHVCGFLYIHCSVFFLFFLLNRFLIKINFILSTTISPDKIFLTGK